MLAAWLPFLYAELNSQPAEKKAREVREGETAEVVVGSAGAEAVPDVPPPEPPVPPPAEPAKPEPAPAPPVAVAPAEPAAAAAATGPAPAAEHAAEPEPPSASGPLEELRHAYETQPRDALWASEAEGKLRAQFGTTEVPAEMLRSASCRRAVCKLQVQWTVERTPAFMALTRHLGEEFGPEVAIAPHEPREGEAMREVDLFFIRKGFTLADLLK